MSTYHTVCQSMQQERWGPWCSLTAADSSSRRSNLLHERIECMGSTGIMPQEQGSKSSSSSSERTNQRALKPLSATPAPYCCPFVDAQCATRQCCRTLVMLILGSVPGWHSSWRKTAPGRRSGATDTLSGRTTRKILGLEITQRSL